MSSVRKNVTGKAHWLLVAAFAVGAFATLFLISKGKPLPTPALIGEAKGEPLNIRGAGGAWHWREQPAKGSGRLVRATLAGVKEIAAADTLSSFDTDGKTLAWTARRGAEWAVMTSDAEGANPRAAWSGKEEPQGVKLAGERIYWLRKTPAPIDISLPFPALQSSLQVVSIPLAGGALEASAPLPESDEGNVLGVYEGALYVRAVRMSSPGGTAIYRIDANKTPERIVSVALHLSALLTKDGVLYWLAPSAETASPQPALQAFRRDKSGAIEPLSDWLPAGGALYETANGVYYADREYPPNFWRIGSQDVFPVASPLPKDFNAVAASESVALIASAGSPRSKPTLYQIPLP